jgi:four helix bundle protein
MEMYVKSYKDLRVWQQAMELAVIVYRHTINFPQTERYGLTSQINRAAVSVVSNIAEGSARGTTKDFLRFVNVAQGSLAELETQLILAARLTFMSDSDVEALLALCDDVGKMLRGLQKSLEGKISHGGFSEDGKVHYLHEPRATNHESQGA